MLSTTDNQKALTQTDEAFKCMHELFDYMNGDSAIEVLKDSLNADLGYREDGAYGDITIHHQVANTVRILRFLRKFPQELSEVFEDTDEDLVMIHEAFDNFSYEETDKVINDGLARWIYAEDKEPVCIEYALSISTVYNQAKEILEMCFAYYEPIVLGTSEKGGVSC